MKALGILNFEPYSINVRGIEEYRPISAASFLGRYRVLDFMISNFTNSGINNLKVFIKNRPRSTVEHVHSTNYNINAKRGKIHMLHGEIVYTNPIYNTDLAAFESNMSFIREVNADLVVVAPSHFVYIQDFNKVVEEHLKKENDITVLYHAVNDANQSYELCDTLQIDEEGRVTAIATNSCKYKHRNISLESYVMSRKLFMTLVERGRKTSSIYWLRDILRDSIDDLKVGTYAHKGYVACMNSLKAYLKANLDLIKEENLNTLIKKDWTIYTMTNDSCPTLYEAGARAVSSIVGNGCDIAGDLENCVIGRGVKIGQGCKIKNTMILPGARIGDNVTIENAVIDRFANVTVDSVLIGEPSDPLYVARGDKI